MLYGCAHRFLGEKALQSPETNEKMTGARPCQLQSHCDKGHDRVRDDADEHLYCGEDWRDCHGTKRTLVSTDPSAIPKKVQYANLDICCLAIIRLLTAYLAGVWIRELLLPCYRLDCSRKRPQRCLLRKFALESILAQNRRLAYLCRVGGRAASDSICISLSEMQAHFEKDRARLYRS